MNSQWAVQGERSNPLALWTITWIARNLGRWAGRLLLYPIVAYFLVALGQVRNYSRAYLQRVLGRPATLMDVARHLHCFAATLLDRIFLLTGRFDTFDIRIHDAEALLLHVRAGRGCILLGSHLGSFEVLRCLARERPELRVKVLMHRTQNPMVMRVVEALNPEIARAVIDTGERASDTVLQVKDALEAGDCVGILGDRVFGDERWTACEFLGAPAPFPVAPYLLASMLQVPVVLFFGIYRGGNRYDIHFEELASELRIARASREQDMQHWAQAYAGRLEQHARGAPYNWFNFYDFWYRPDAPANF